MDKLKKRGASVYISWIIVFALVVGISFFLYNWTLEQAKKTSEDIEARTDPVVCSEVGIAIVDACQTYNTLEITLSNVNNIDLEGFLLRTVGLYPEDNDYLDSQVVYAKIRSHDTDKIITLKKRTLAQIEVVPIVNRNNKNIYCEGHSVKKEKGELLQC
jgi:uncharacterized protein YpmB